MTLIGERASTDSQSNIIGGNATAVRIPEIFNFNSLAASQCAYTVLQFMFC